MRALATAGLIVAGCAYQAGSFHSTSQSFAGQQASLDCLDLAIDRRPDLPSGGAVVAYQFGNRCDHPAVVDLARVAIVGRTDDGRQIALTAYDPRHEIEVLRIDGRAVGQEVIAYPSDTQLHDVCIDAASIAHVSTTQWLCFASRPQLVEVP